MSGLPTEWAKTLCESDLTQDDIVQNGTALLDVLRFHFNGVDNLIDSIPQLSLKKRSSQSIILQDKDPSLSYIGLNQRLGEGGYSSVYKATHRQTGQPVAIKVCSKENYKYIQHEIELQSQSHHPCIVSLQECFQWGNRIYVCISALHIHLFTLTNLSSFPV